MNYSIFWDDTNNRLGVGTNAPTQAIELGGVAASIKLPSDGSLFLIGTRFATNNGSIYFGDVNALGTPINLIPQGGGANGSINFGAVALAQFKGKGSTSATTSLLVQNSAGTASFQIKAACSCNGVLMDIEVKETLQYIMDLTPYQLGLLFSELAETRPVLADNIRQIIEETLEELKS